MNRFTFNDAGRLDFDLAVSVGLDLTLAVDRNTDTVDHAADQCFTNRNLDDPLGALDRIAFLDVFRVAEDRRTDVVFLEVKDHAHGVAGKLQQLAGHRLVQAMDTGNTVTDGDNGTGFTDLDITAEAFDLLLDYRADFFCSDLHCDDLITLSLRILRFA